MAAAFALPQRNRSERTSLLELAAGAYLFARVGVEPTWPRQSRLKLLATSSRRCDNYGMANCDIYAAGDDFSRILDFIFDQPDWLLIEHSSRPDSPLRRFGSTYEVLGAFDLGGSDALFDLYSASMGAPVVEERLLPEQSLARRDAPTRRDGASFSSTYGPLEREPSGRRTSETILVCAHSNGSRSALTGSDQSMLGTGSKWNGFPDVSVDLSGSWPWANRAVG